MKEIKIYIVFHFVEIVDREFVLVVSKRAHITEFAGLKIVRVSLAKLGLVLFGVVEVFSRIVGVLAVVSEVTIMHVAT